MTKKHRVVLGFILYWICILQIQTAFAQESKVTVNSILKENIISIVSLPTYNAELQSGDEFVYILPLGLALDIKALTFNNLSFNELSADRTALDNGYLFARMVNDILVFKGNSYGRGKALENFGDKSKLLTSPTYANSFGITGIVPSPKHISWEKFNKVQRGEVQYLLNFDLGRLNLERGWLDMASLRNEDLPSGSSIIIGLILTKDIRLDLYREKFLSDRLKSDDVTIVGFICIVV